MTPFWGKSISLFAPIPIRLDINRDNTSRSQSHLSDGQVFPDTQNRSNLPHFWVKISYFWSLQSSLVSSGPKIVRQNLIYKADEMEAKQFVKFMTGRNPYRNVGLSQQWFINLFSRLFAEDFADPRNPNLEICLWKQQFNMNFFFTKNSFRGFLLNCLKRGFLVFFLCYWIHYFDLCSEIGFIT